LAEQPHEKADFSSRASFPVFSRECVQRERGDADACSRFDRAAYRRHTRAMACNARKMAPAGPAAVAVHNDGDVPGKLSLELQIQLSLFVAETGRNSGAQFVLSRVLKVA